ncbi:cryptochrome/photolyase family protein [Dongia rigui]|uniref:Deoxyribodipyrimidine photo-lyase n=1 Tax=Dongia rigui TaxID=940149 RepID=A0ABU5E358_9PROT|nr:deoxyribodipyrimidine photo-lyase [Dongia rigui]MDY0874064.1 deoxyribodipyrimidine photo-lyase [Dongia rigui]
MNRTHPPILIWLRRDLRLDDNPAIFHAAKTGRPVIPFFVDDDKHLGGAARWWRGRSLLALDSALRSLGSHLVVRRGDALDQVMSLAQESGATALHFNRRLEPRGLAIDAKVVTAARAAGIEIVEHHGNRLHDPWTLKTLKGDPFRVFTPFWRRLAESYQPPAPCPAPTALTAPSTWPGASDLAALEEHAPWTAGMTTQWRPGEAGAQAMLQRLPEKLADYGTARDRPDIEGTSRLSPHLAWGEISVHALWRQLSQEGSPSQNGYLRELGWRDFNSHLLYHFPRLPVDNWNRQFDAFPYRSAPTQLAAWQKGLTGYPIVDAGMRELWTTGWMHNRVRMITASFLIKDLLLDWRDGEKWFWDTLVDADLAQNAGNWQWVAGSGADAAPYFRVFNPITQGIKFDPEGTYVRRWLPELAKLPTHAIHEPSTASLSELSAAHVSLGRSYPLPLVDHAKARLRALATLKALGTAAAAELATTDVSSRQNSPNLI